MHLQQICVSLVAGMQRLTLRGVFGHWSCRLGARHDFEFAGVKQSASTVSQELFKKYGNTLGLLIGFCLIQI